MKNKMYENDISEVIAILDAGYSSDCEIDKDKVNNVIKKTLEGQEKITNDIKKLDICLTVHYIIK